VCTHAQTDPLPSWNDGPAKQAILAFVQATTDKASPQFVPPEVRIATFDQDGTTWVEHPMYTQVVYCLEQVKGLAERQPELKNVERHQGRHLLGRADGRGQEQRLGPDQHEERLAAHLRVRAVTGPSWVPSPWWFFSGSLDPHESSKTPALQRRG
jgi:hypothetical protein